jgi:hypothetical protein
MKDGGRRGLDEEEGWRNRRTGRGGRMEEEEDWTRRKDGGRRGLKEDEGWRKKRIGRGGRMEE